MDVLTLNEIFKQKVMNLFKKFLSYFKKYRFSQSYAEGETIQVKSHNKNKLI